MFIDVKVYMVCMMRRRGEEENPGMETRKERKKEISVILFFFGVGF